MKSALAATILVVGLMAVAAVQDIVLFDGSVKDGWTFANWFGATLSAIDDPSNQGRKILKFTASKEAKAWAGSHFTTMMGSIPGGNAPALPKELAESGKLTFLINGSDDEFGFHHGEQNIQVCLGKRVSEQGEWKTGPYLAIAPFIEGKAVDSNKESWQKASIPLSSLLKAVDLDCIGSIGFQFVDATPSAGVLIDKIRIE
ncbi:MAG: hypothetical protein WAX69_10225 [Victivallales bacterium]